MYSEEPFRSTFPHFGTEEYWENETRDLEEQVGRIELGSSESGTRLAGAAPAAAEPELGNKDFFWDL